jgi:hypothetical protein
MTDPEVIVNLWYYIDESKEYIFSLAGELRHTHDSDNAGAYRRENNDDIYALHTE